MIFYDLQYNLVHIILINRYVEANIVNFGFTIWWLITVIQPSVEEKEFSLVIHTTRKIAEEVYEFFFLLDWYINKMTVR